MRNEYKILFIAFILRVIPFGYVATQNPSGFLLYDSYGYLNLAENIKTHKVFSRASKNQVLNPDISRTPLFPLLLAGIKTIINHQIAIVLFILIAGTTNALLTYKLCLKIFNSNKLGYIASIFVAIDIPSIYFSNVIMTEIIFTTLLISLLIFYINYLQTKKLIDLFFSGVLISLLILCRPIAIFLPFALIFPILSNPKKRMHIPTFILISYLLVFGWISRNYNTFETFQISSISSINLYLYTSASIIAEAENLSTNKAQDKLKNELEEAFNWSHNKNDIAPMIAYCNSNATQIILNNPLIFIKQTTKGIIFFFIKPIRNYIDTFLGINSKYYSALVEKKTIESIAEKLSKETSLLTIILIIIQILTSIILIAAIVYTIVKIRISLELWSLLIVIIYFALTSSITEVDGRFRIPVLPLMAIIASNGILKMMTYIYPTKITF